MSKADHERYDVVIIGGGPGGSTAGTLLSRAGKKVLLLEKETFPRFRIGESLLPFGNEIMEELGVWEKVQRGGFTVKIGAEFVTSNSSRTNRIWFKNSLTPQYTQTYQVERCRFDQILLDHSRENGCEVRENCAVEAVSLSEDGANISYKENGEPRRVESRWLIDASGRDTFLARHLNIPRKDLNMPKKIATYAHFHGVYRNPGDASGIITVVRLKGGWFWIIPLDEQKTSVGLVQPLAAFKAAGGTGEEVFKAAVEANQEIAFRMKNAQRVNEFRNTSDYTYRITQVAGPRWLLAGDAGGFIDPIFSSGVMISMKTASLASKLILKADAEGRPLSEAERIGYRERVYAMMNVFLKMIRTFYDDYGFEVFMNPVRSRTRWGIPAAVTSVLAGDTENPFMLQWRIRLFYFISWLQRWIKVAPRLNYAPRPAAQPGDLGLPKAPAAPERETTSV